MVAQNLHETILQGNIGRVLGAITNAEAFIGRQHIDFPRIAVFGDESCGKSSMLEAICKIPFPRGNKTTTRCPTILRTQHKPGARWSAIAWTGYHLNQRKNEIHVRKPEDVAKIISDLQSTLLTDGSVFSSEPVRVSIEAEDAVDLTLVDLPGYFSNEGRGIEGGGNVSLVKDCLLTYLKDENTIVLVVVPANQLVKTVNIFDLLKEYERSLSGDDLLRLRARTIYCFTKCDLVSGDPGTPQGPSYDIEEILSNQGNFAAQPHGWYAVVNNKSSPQGNADFMIRLSSDREQEEAFFDEHSPYNKSYLRTRCGTNNLVQMLSSLLAEKISEKISTMLSQTNIALSQANQALRKLGNPPPQERDFRTECRTILDDIKDYYVQATEGMYGRLKDEVEDLSGELSKGDLEKCELAFIKKLRCDLFADEIKRARLRLNDPTYLMELRQKVERAVNGKFEATMPIPEVLFEEVRVCAKRWRGLGETMCNDIADAAIECLGVLVRVKAGKYEHLPDKLYEYLKNMIEEQRTKARNRLDWHYVDEVVRPNTLNVFFVEGIKAMKKVPGLGMDKDANRDAYVCNLRAYLEIAEARYTDNVVRTVTTHIMDVPKGSRMTRVDSEAAPTYSFQAPQILDIEDHEDLMKIRDDLSAKRNTQMAKVNVLNELHAALRAMPAAIQTVYERNQIEEKVLSRAGSINGVTNMFQESEDKIIESLSSDVLSRPSSKTSLSSDVPSRPSSKTSSSQPGLAPSSQYPETRHPPQQPYRQLENHSPPPEHLHQQSATPSHQTQQQPAPSAQQSSLMERMRMLRSSDQRRRRSRD